MTFQDGNVAQRVLSQTHRLRHSTLNITHADPKGAVRGGPAPAGSQYGYGYGSQFYNPQAAQGFYYGYGTPQAAQYNFTRGFPPQPSFPRGTAPQAASSGATQQPRGEQYQPNDAPPPPPAKRPHPSQGGQQYMPDPAPESHYAAYGGGGEAGGMYGGGGYGGGTGRYRESGGGWQPQQ